MLFIIIMKYQGWKHFANNFDVKKLEALAKYRVKMEQVICELVLKQNSKGPLSRLSWQRASFPQLNYRLPGRVKRYCFLLIIHRPAYTETADYTECGVSFDAEETTLGVAVHEHKCLVND